MSSIDKQYTDLLQDILDNGFEKDTRNGKVLSVFGRTIRHSMKNGFPLITTKKMHFKGIVTELLWFLKGDTNIKYLIDNDCNIWNGDALKAYHKHELEEINKFRKEDPFTLVDFQRTTKEEFINKIKTDDEFAKKWGELGPIYGKQWRSWSRVTYNNEHRSGFYNPIDQIANLINDLKKNPDSRRLMVNAWNVGELDQMVLPPCHYGFQVYTRENNGQRYISLMWNQRSVDTPLGLPFNIASYALLLEIIAKQVNMIPEEVIGNLGDCHIYTNQIDGVKEQLTREPYSLPKLVHMKTDDFYKSLSDNPSLFGHLDSKDFQIEGYQSHPAIKMPLSN